MLIGGKFQSVRKILGISQDDMASKIGISRSQLSQIEAQKFNPTIDNIITIARLLNIPYEYFFEENENIIEKVNQDLLKFKRVKSETNNSLNVVSEGNSEYKTSCKLCEKNNKLIDLQEKYIKTLEKRLQDCEDSLSEALTHPKKDKKAG